MKSIEYYTQKREEAQARIVQIEKILSASNHVVRWKYDGDRLRAERAQLNDDIKGYNCIIAHLESGIDISAIRTRNTQSGYLKPSESQNGG